MEKFKSFNFEDLRPPEGLLVRIQKVQCSPEDLGGLPFFDRDRPVCAGDRVLVRTSFNCFYEACFLKGV